MVNRIKMCYSSADVWVGQKIGKSDGMTVACVSFCLLMACCSLQKWLSKQIPSSLMWSTKRHTQTHFKEHYRYSWTGTMTEVWYGFLERETESQRRGFQVCFCQLQRAGQPPAQRACNGLEYINFFSNLQDVHSFVDDKRRYFENASGFSVHSVLSVILNSDYIHFMDKNIWNPQSIISCLPQKNVIQIWNDIHFWVNYPLMEPS